MFQADLKEGLLGWEVGPLPFSHGSVLADSDTRRKYFSTEAGLALYGRHESGTRWHRVLDVQWQSCRIAGLEILKLPSSAGGRALAIIHTELPPESLLEKVVSASSRPNRAQAGDGINNSTFVPLFGGDAMLRRDPFTLAFRTFEDCDPTPPPGDYGHVGLSASELWCWCLASRSTSFDYPPEPEAIGKLTRDFIVLSSDWKALVLRDGASFVGQRGDLGAADPFFGFATLYVQTIYLDCILLGIAQRIQVEEMAARIAVTLSTGGIVRNLPSMETDLIRFRNLWWTHRLSNHDVANNLLCCYQNQHGLTGRFEAVATQISELSRVVQMRNSQYSTASLGTLTVIGLPLGTALSVLQVLEIKGILALLVGVMIAFVAATVILLTPFGRVIFRMLRGVSRPEDPAAATIDPQR